MFESSSSSNTLQAEYPYILKKNNTENLEFMCLNSPFLETATYQFCQPMKQQIPNFMVFSLNPRYITPEARALTRHNIAEKLFTWR
jgi:hypothetical protein